MISLGDALKLTASDFAGVFAVVTDPPYGIGLQSHCKRGVKDRKAEYNVVGDDSQRAGNHVLSVARAARVPVIAFFASPWKPWPGKWRNLIVWDKGGGTGFGGDTAKCLRRTWELIQVDNNSKITDGRPESVWRATFSNAIFKHHPCAKPVSLLKRLISTFVDQENALVFDPFMGSGSTGVACAELGLPFRGLEIDPIYCEAATRRIKKANEENANKLFPAI
jgi:tRNA G10  N-methylase Trm11